MAAEISDAVVWPSRRRLAVIAVAAAAALWLGWSIISDTAAYNLALAAPERALRWASNEPTALGQLAYRTITNSDDDGESTGDRRNTAKQFAQRALRSNPSDARALMLLGLIARQDDDEARAVELMRLSGSRTWRDMTTQIWLFTNGIQNADYEGALAHFDAIQRVNPALGPQFFPLLTEIVERPQVLDATVAFLRSDPPWKSRFLSAFAQSVSNPDVIDRLFAGLQPSLNAAELRPFLDRFIRDGKFSIAHRIWQEARPSDQKGKTQHLFNANFSLPMDGLPFNWRLPSTRGANIRIVRTPGRTSRTLQLQFSGARVRFEQVGQLLVLPPGAYQFSGRVRAEQLRAPRGVWWRIFCAEKDGETLARTDLVSSAMPWTNFSIQFTVPAAGCEAQWLRLEIPARIASESQIDGQVWFENLMITQSVDRGHSTSLSAQ